MLRIRVPEKKKTELIHWNLIELARFPERAEGNEILFGAGAVCECADIQPIGP
jgi:hypothetical protein